MTAHPQPRLSIIVVCDADAGKPSGLLESIRRELKRLPFEVILADNAFGCDFRGLEGRAGAPLRILSEPAPLKPQAMMKKAMEAAAGDLIVLHNAGDILLPGYEDFLLARLEVPRSGRILRLPIDIRTESALFRDRPLAYGYCLPAALVREGLSYDFMYWESRPAEVVEEPGAAPVFAYRDAPLWTGRVPARVSLIATVKNRLAHWKRTFPHLVAQRGVDYELVVVDYFSEDELEALQHEYILARQASFSPDLKGITVVRLKENRRFSPCKAKNLGARHAAADSGLFAFSDIDTFLREDFLSYWASRAASGDRFCPGRRAVDRRVGIEVNYGTAMIPRDMFLAVQGFNETITGYGGDDDECYHRLRNHGAAEANPSTPEEARQYSILHGADLRLKELEVAALSGLQDWKFLEDKASTWSRDDSWGRQPAARIRYEF